MINRSEYTGTETFQLLVKGIDVLSVLEDWLERRVACDLRLRRAKTPGHVVIELQDAVYAQHIRNWHPDSKVNIKDK